MTSSDLAAVEANRLATLRRSGLLDSPPEEIFDQWTALASRVLKTPVVLMSLVDRDRQFFKSQVGLPEPWAEKRETPLSYSFCQYVVALDQPLVVTDARALPLVRDNLAVRDLGVIAYAGVPLTTTGGETLGSFCAIDTKPRDWTGDELEILRALAEQAMTQINLRIDLEKGTEQLERSRANNREREVRFQQDVHDLRTPLTAVTMGLDAVEISGPLNEQQRRFWKIAQENARALSDLVRTILETPAKAAAISEFQPEEIVRSALGFVGPLADRAGIVIDTSALAKVPPIDANPQELVRVLTNLLANAVKFTPRGGRVFVRLEEARNDGTPSVRFVVTDEGIGIAPEDQKTIFGAGVKLHRFQEGNGIGLSYCKRVIEARGGEIKVESALGQGSTFSFFIPQQS